MMSGRKGGKKGKGGGGRKVNVMHTGIAEAPFIQQLRAKHGLKSREEQRNNDLNAKFDKKRRDAPRFSDDDDDDDDDPNLLDVRDEEQPTVVVLNKGDLTQSEAEQAILAGAEGAQGVLSAANATTVKQRLQKDRENMKRTLHATTKKTKHKDRAGDGDGDGDGDGGAKGGKQQKKKKAKKGKLAKSLSKKNTGLLSFGDDM
ncbi:hypothetical protein PTSG_06534 [Salpingoeca rosetta]|uniref:DUF4604 domain-containing protein n=1 Tax=Salpingoeca rosetta (strain ATCC 50818 / BSB-021) TaxID=946362 RepID=F2UG33_SALR5|nr:uncharacterized protein PTSG_06534 [Salpingoeca rosetta]EGD75461.1 hypothetical protein PTSG_06534 [Salpingoeca rosetta]|eukprot:XP_004991918.1 hypothetical protein PTSG_06534 [Salpingoeca rosetta]